METFLSLVLKIYILLAGTSHVISEGINVPPQYTDVDSEYISEGINVPPKRANMESDYISDNVVEVSNDQWNMMDEAATLQDLHAILGIKAEVHANVGPVALMDSLQRSAATDRYLINPDLTICTPELQSVALALPDIRGKLHFPKCVQVKRCGGCCVSAAKICRPTHSSKLIVKVMKLTTVSKEETRRGNRRNRRNRGNSRRQRDTDSVLHESLNVTVTEHTQCGCQCRVTEADCNLLLQNYDKHTCSCNCKNRDKRQKCSDDHLRYWSEETCDCKCRNRHTTSCSTGNKFSPSTCSCERAAELSSFDYFLRRTEDKFKERFGQIAQNFEI